MIFEGFSLKTYKNQRYLEFSSEDYLKSHQIQRGLIVICPDLDGSGQNNITGDKTQNRLVQLETRWNLNQMIQLAFQVSFGFCFHPLKSFGSSPGRNGNGSSSGRVFS